jgi:hypothetical protein
MNQDIVVHFLKGRHAIMITILVILSVPIAMVASVSNLSWLNEIVPLPKEVKKEYGNYLVLMPMPSVFG